MQPIFAERLALALDEVASNLRPSSDRLPPAAWVPNLDGACSLDGTSGDRGPWDARHRLDEPVPETASETVQTVEEAIGRKVAWDFVKFLITRYEPSDGPQTQMAGYLRSILAG